MIYISTSVHPVQKSCFTERRRFLVSELVFLAIVFASMFAVSMVVALVIHDSEQDTSFVQTTIEVFWSIVHVASVVALAASYIGALLWSVRII